MTKNLCWSLSKICTVLFAFVFMFAFSLTTVQSAPTGFVVLQFEEDGNLVENGPIGSSEHYSQSSHHTPLEENASAIDEKSLDSQANQISLLSSSVQDSHVSDTQSSTEESFKPFLKWAGKAKSAV